MKKILALLLAAVMVLSMAACNPATPAGTNGTNDGTTGADAGYVNPYADMEYDDKSAAIYEAVLGEFAEAYEAAKAATTVSERFALMAVAEAKLMESGVMLPLTSNGGNYAISRAVPNTVTSTLWGNDSYRYHNILVATEFIKAADRDALKAKWAELAGTGTWEAEAAKFMEEKGYTLTDTYTIGYSSDPQTWDVLATARAADSEAIVNTYDGLVEYNSENVLMPALAESWEESEDKTVFTFKLRQGLKWVDSQGREVADLKADDFVAGMQHMLDTGSDLGYLAYEAAQIVGSGDYYNGDITDFAEVGVKALDDYTVQYTLAQPNTFFMTMLGYGVFAPMSRSYYESKGGAFGADYAAAAEAETYTYGMTPNAIAYCGPYLVTNATEKNTIVFSANPSYWNADGITMKTITWLYNDGEDALKGYNDAKSGVLSGSGLNASALEACKNDGLFEDYGYVSATDATSFMAFANVNRGAFANVNDENVAVSSQDEATALRTFAAMQNVNFRRAIAFATDRGTYNAQTVGDELALTSVINSYTPGTFVTLEEDVTISINGTDTTFAAGTKYGAIMQAQIDADGVKMTVWDPEADSGIGSSAGFDGWYSVENAKAELAEAVEALAAQGVEVSAENPIYIDLPYFSGSEAYGNRANGYKKSIETALEGAVIVNLVECVDPDAWYYAGYYTNYGYEGNYDIYDVSGWGPDYGDPQTYLDTFLPDYSGYMVKCIGIF